MFCIEGSNLTLVGEDQVVFDGAACSTVRVYVVYLCDYGVIGIGLHGIEARLVLFDKVMHALECETDDGCVEGWERWAVFKAG
jgi:hypothetical protein